MFKDDSSKAERVEVAIHVLTQALQELRKHDYASAEVMVAVSRQIIEDLQLDFEQHFQVQEMLKQLLKRSIR